MSDETQERPTRGRKPLSLRGTTEKGSVKQSFSHGRTKTVEVVKKRRVAGPGGQAGAAAKGQAQNQAPDKTKVAELEPKRETTRVSPGAAAGRAKDVSPRKGKVVRRLSDEEAERRKAALAIAQKAAKEKAAREAKEREERERREAEERARLEETRKKAEEEEQKRRA
jgi:translation initiation factor IF-2